MRPAGRDGQGEDRGRGQPAAASSSATRRARSPSSASPPGVADTLDGQLDGIAERVEKLADRVLLYADDGEAAAVAVHERGLQPEAVLVRRSSLEDVFLRLTGRSLIE